MRAALSHPLAAAVAVATVLIAPALAGAEDRPTPGNVGPLTSGGAFVIQSCGETGSSDGWSPLTAPNQLALDGGAECPPVSGHSPGYPTSLDQTGLWVSDRLGTAGGALEASAGDHAEVIFTPVSGTTITRLRYWRKVMKVAEDDYTAYVAIGTRGNVADSCEIAGQPLCQVGADDWIPNDRNQSVTRFSYRELANIAANSIILGVACRDDNVTHTCGNGFYLVHAEVELFSAFLTIADPTPPTVGTPSGAGWTADGWVQGTLPLALPSSDATGIAATRVYADGSLIATLQRSCAYDRPRPCTDEPTGAVGLPTAGLTDGMHAIVVDTVDAAGNATRVSRPTPLAVDNRAPAAPVALASPAPTSSTDRFAARWALPADAGTPIVAARYQLCQAGSCGAVQTAPSLTGLDDLALPAAGPATLRVWLVDALGHEDAAGAATLALSYAPVTPAPSITPLPAPAPVLPSPPPTPTPTSTPPTATKYSASLKLTSVRHSGRHLIVRGTLAARASGRVTVRFAARVGGRRHALTVRPRIARRAFRATLTLPRSFARARAGTVTASYAGDADTRRATRQATIRWRG